MVCWWHKDRNIDQWNRIGKSEINPCAYDQIIFNKGVKATQLGKDNGIGKTRYPNEKE